MTEIKNLLFICSRNKWRSKTAETVFKNHKGISVRSAGTSKVAENKVSKKLITWADEIYVMEKKHKEIMERKFGKITKSIYILNIPDEYQYMDEELVKELQEVINHK